jgi:hypothetical protein
MDHARILDMPSPSERRMPSGSSLSPAVQRPAPAAAPLRGIRFLTNGVGLATLVSLAITAWILFGLGGWAYYTTPLGVRGYAQLHPLLRPSGPVGQTLGVIGAALMLVPFLYMMRKRLVKSPWAGSLRIWLEVHLFCGIVGPVLVTFHSSFKFNGLVSAAYWAMVVVVASGFIGRYLYVRIPRTLRGTELSHAELDERANELLGELVEKTGKGPWLEKALELEWAVLPKGGRRSLVSLLFGEIALRWRVRAFARQIRQSGLAAGEQRALIQVMTERALILRRLAYLQKTKAVFALWHVFHLPLVYLLLGIVILHVGLALYLGYVPFRW